MRVTADWLVCISICFISNEFLVRLRWSRYWISNPYNKAQLNSFPEWLIPWIIIVWFYFFFIWSWNWNCWRKSSFKWKKTLSIYKNWVNIWWIEYFFSMILSFSVTAYLIWKLAIKIMTIIIAYIFILFWKCSTCIYFIGFCAFQSVFLLLFIIIIM